MDEGHTRIVVGEGQTLRKGLLRFVLEGEGYDVVAEASTSAELARVVATQDPDVVVLDDGIGATAVQMTRELAPQAKVILVWPGAVVPIGGDARVEPAEVLKDLGGAVERVTGRSGQTSDEPGGIEGSRTDPARREPLAPDEGAPVPPAPDEAGPSAPVVILPVSGAPEAGADEPIVVLGGEDATARQEVPTMPDAAEPNGAADAAEPAKAEAERDAGVIPLLPRARTDEAGAEAPAGDDVAERRDPAAEWNRRLGTIALGGAAVAGALVLALSLGGSRIPTDVFAEAPSSGVTPSPIAGDPGMELDGEGAGPAPLAPGLVTIPTPLGVSAPLREEVPGPLEPPGPDEPPEGPTEPGGPTEPPQGPNEPPQGPTEPPQGPTEPPQGPNEPEVRLPGASASNPHDGPPGITGDPPDTPAADNGSNAGGNGHDNGHDAGGNGHDKDGWNNAGGNGNGKRQGNGPPEEHPGQGHGHDGNPGPHDR